jgi:hypothetical protein
MKRFFATILTTFLVAAGVVAVTGSAAQANHRCNYITISRTIADTFLIYNDTFNFHSTPRLYSSNAVHCDRAVRFLSAGWKFDADGCGNMWVRAVNGARAGQILPGSETRVCGGNGRWYILYCCLSESAIVRVEGHHEDPNERDAMDAFAGTIGT